MQLDIIIQGGNRVLDAYRLLDKNWKCYFRFFQTPFPGAFSGSQERRLLSDLLETGYNSLERPVYNDTDAINLTFGLTLQQIIDVVMIL